MDLAGLGHAWIIPLDPPHSVRLHRLCYGAILKRPGRLLFRLGPPCSFETACDEKRFQPQDMADLQPLPPGCWTGNPDHAMKVYADLFG